MSNKIRAAFIGGSEDGKTFLAGGVSRGWWRRDGFRSIVFDPYHWENDWGRQALVFGEKHFERWRALVDKIRIEQRFAVIWDEATDFGGRDSDNVGLVTAVRHNAERCIVIGHGFASMLPRMRGSLTDLVISAVHPDDLREWARLFNDDAIMQAAALRKYEFLHKRKHQPVKILRHTAEQIRAGIVL